MVNEARDLVVAGGDTPQEVVRRATEQANVLMGIVNKQGGAFAVAISGNRYLKFEAWQTIARFNRATPIVEWTRPILDDGKVIGYEARVQVVQMDTREVIAAAEAMCGLDEFVAQGQKGALAKQNAVRSMAQTRAGAKAFRMGYSFVAVLAGFQATPAEEMGQQEREATAPPKPRQQAPRGRRGPPTEPETQEAADSQPGASEGHDWTAFWPQVKEMGYEPPKVWGALGVKNADAWFSQGKGLEDALADLRALKG